MNLFKKIGEFFVSFWDSLTHRKEITRETYFSADFDKNPPLPAVAVPDEPDPDFDNIPGKSETVFYFNPFTGLLKWTWIEGPPDDPCFFAVPEQLEDAAEKKTDKYSETYVRFTDHRSELGKWASDLRKTEGIVYDRKSVATQNKAIAALAKAFRRGVA